MKGHGGTAVGLYPRREKWTLFAASFDFVNYLALVFLSGWAENTQR